MATKYYEYEVCYLGNGNQPLSNTPVFKTRAAAEEYAAETNGCGLRYGAYVRKVGVTDRILAIRADVARVLANK